MIIVSDSLSSFGQGLSEKYFLERLGQLIDIITIISSCKWKFLIISLTHFLVKKENIHFLCRELPTCAVKILLEHLKATLVTYSVLFLLYKENQKIIKDTFENVCFSQTVHHWHPSLETHIKAKPLLSKTPLLLFKLSFT